MNLTLARNKFTLYGILGVLSDGDGNQIAITLEHAYEQKGGSYAPKIAPGAYLCKRGQHRLAGMNNTFETFEITGVPPFMGSPVSGILIHKGNTNNDSEGCVLVGQEMGQGCILESALAFARFLDLQVGCDEFTLIVK